MISRFVLSECQAGGVRTYFYYDKASGKLFAENITIIGRVLRKCFGYKKEFNRTNLWEYLKDRKLVTEPDLPSKDKFRTIVETAFIQTTKTIESIVAKPDSISEKDFQKLFESKVFEANDLLTGAPFEDRFIGMFRYDHFTPLSLAIRGRHSNLALTLLDKGANPDQPNRLEWDNGKDVNSLESPLHNAVIHQNAPVFDAIVQKRGTLPLPTDGPFPLLHRAIDTTSEDAQAHIHIIKRLLELGANLNEKCASGLLPLTYALVALNKKPCPENKEVVRLLLEKGAQPSSDDLFVALNSREYLPHTHYFHSVSSLERKTIVDEELINWLLAHKAVPTLRCLVAALDPEYDKTSTPHPCNSNVFKALLERLNPSPKQINARIDRDFHEYLMAKALRVAKADVIQLLLDKGADLAVLPEKTNNAIQIILEWSSYYLTDYHREKLILLFNRGVKPRDVDLEKFIERVSPMEINPVNVEILGLFLKSGVVPNDYIIKAIGRLAVRSTNSANPAAMLRYLLDAFPNLDLQSETVETLLVQSINYSNVEMLKVLLSKGADPRKEFKHKFTFSLKNEVSYSPKTALE